MFSSEDMQASIETTLDAAQMMASSSPMPIIPSTALNPNLRPQIVQDKIDAIFKAAQAYTPLYVFDGNTDDYAVICGPITEQRKRNNYSEYPSISVKKLVIQLSQLAKKQRPSKPFTVLDIGTGYGWFPHGLRQAKISAVGLSLERMGEESDTYIIADAEALPQAFTPGTRFSVIIGIKAFRHFVDLWGAIVHAYNMLEPGGFLILDELHLCVERDDSLIRLLNYIKRQGIEFYTSIFDGNTMDFGEDSRYPWLNMLILKKTSDALQLPLAYHDELSLRGKAVYHMDPAVLADSRMAEDPFHEYDQSKSVRRTLADFAMIFGLDDPSAILNGMGNLQPIFISQRNRQLLRLLKGQITLDDWVPNLTPEEVLSWYTDNSLSALGYAVPLVNWLNVQRAEGSALRSYVDKHIAPASSSSDVKPSVSHLLFSGLLWQVHPRDVVSLINTLQLLIDDTKDIGYAERFFSKQDLYAPIIASIANYLCQDPRQQQWLFEALVPCLIKNLQSDDYFKTILNMFNLILQLPMTENNDFNVQMYTLSQQMRLFELCVMVPNLFYISEWLLHHMMQAEHADSASINDISAMLVKSCDISTRQSFCKNYVGLIHPVNPYPLVTLRDTLRTYADQKFSIDPGQVYLNEIVALLSKPQNVFTLTSMDAHNLEFLLSLSGESLNIDKIYESNRDFANSCIDCFSFKFIDNYCFYKEIEKPKKYQILINEDRDDLQYRININGAIFDVVLNHRSDNINRETVRVMVMEALKMYMTSGKSIASLCFIPPTSGMVDKAMPNLMFAIRHIAEKALKNMRFIPSTMKGLFQCLASIQTNNIYALLYEVNAYMCGGPSLIRPSSSISAISASSQDIVSVGSNLYALLALPQQSRARDVLAEPTMENSFS